MTGTFKTKTRVYTSSKFVTPISGRKSFVDAAVDFRRGLIENSSMAVLNADLAVKAAMGAGLSSSAPSIGQAAQGSSPDSDGTKRVNKGGVPGMEEDEQGYRYMPEATWGPDKVLNLFPSQEQKQSSNKVPNFGFIDKKPTLTPEQFVEQMEQKPKIRMSKYKINTRTGEPIEDTEVEFDRMRFGKTFDLNPDASDEIEENISEETDEENSNGIQEKSLGSSLKQRMPGSSIAGRAAARFGVIMDELGKMRCPPGTPAANQFTDMTGSNCFGVTPGNIISEAINLAQKLIPEDDPKRSGFAKRIANFMFDMENGIFGNNVWYHADGTRMKHGEWRKFREAGGVAKNERWMVNGVERVFAELEAQDARMADLFAKLGVDVSDAKKAVNDDVYEAFEKLRESGVIPTTIFGRATPAQVEAMMVGRLKNMDAHWIARTDDEKKILIDIEVKRYRELERAHLEAFLDEVIKNPEHMQSITALRMVQGGNDRASYGIDGIVDGVPVGSIEIDIPNGLAFQDSMLPNLSPDERLRIWAEGGQSDAVRAMAVKDFLVNSNSHAGQMIAMVDGGRGLGRHDMKHEIAHSIQAAAIFEHMKSELDARGSLIIPGKKTKNGRAKDTVITSIDQLNSTHLMNLMMSENYMGIDLESLSNLRSRGDVVAFLAGKYIDDVQSQYGDMRRAAEIGAELWALRSAGLIYGDDVDAALEYMDNVVSGKITADRTIGDDVLTQRIYDAHLDGERRIREAADSLDPSDEDFFDADDKAKAARISAAREAYAKSKRAEVKATKEAAKTMSEDEMVDFLASSTEASDALSDLLDAATDAGEEPNWMAVMDRDTLDAQSKAVVDEWVKRFTVRRSPEALEKLQKLVDDKRESRGTLSPEKIEERRYREFMEGAAERAKDMDLGELVQNYSDWEEISSGEGIDAPERLRMKEMRDMYRDEYIKRRTEGPDSVSKEDARKEFNSKFKELRKPKTAAERRKKEKAKAKKFTSHNGKDGARTFATEERARTLEGATTAEKIAFVEMGDGQIDVANMMEGTDEGIAAARAIQRRNTRLKKNGILPDGLNQHEASIEEQVENIYIPFVELMDKSSLSQAVEVHVDSDDDAAAYITDLLNGDPPEFTTGVFAATLVTDKTDFSDGKKIIIRVPEGSKGLFPDWSYYSESDDGEQKMFLPPSKFHLVEVRDDGTVVLEVGEQQGTEAILKDAVHQIGPGPRDGDVAYRQGLQKKVNKVVDKRIAERRRQGMFDPERSSPIEEERFEVTADAATSSAGFIPDGPPPAPSEIGIDGKPKAPRGVARKRATAAIDRAKDSASAQKELDAINSFITGEGAYQGRTNFMGTKVASIMESNFGTRNISELTEEQKYDLVDLISEAMGKAPNDQQRGLSQARSRIQDHIDISKMMSDNNYNDPYAGGPSFNTPDYLDPNYIPPDNRRLSSGAKWGQMPSSNEQIARLLEPSNNDGFNEIYGPPQTREERITQMTEMQSEVMTSLREMIDNVPGAGDSIGLELANIDPVLADFIKNSSDEEIYKLVAESAKNLHQSFDARPRVRMRQDELDRFASSGRYGREESFNTERLSSGLVKKGIKARAKERAIEMIAERIGKDEDSREIAEMVLDTASALKYGPEAALTRLAIDLGRRGSRDIAERTVQELVERGKITDEQAKSIMSKIDKVAPDGLPDPLKRGVGRAARAAADALDTPENRERLENAREAVGEAAGRAREAVGEGARNIAERGRERLRKLRERDDAGSLPSAPDDVAFGDFDPADAPAGRLSSGKRLDRRVANSENGRERIMEGANVTRTRLSSGETPKAKPPKKPSRPREPDNGPMTGKFIDIFRGVKSYQEMLDRYNEQEVIFFDYETTGFDPKVEKPVQLGAVKMKGGKVVERFNVFINPGKGLSDWSKENLVDADGNPLTDEWLSGQMSIADAHQQLVDFFGPDALLGGQYTPFDLGFLEESLKGAGIEWTPAGVMDSKALADELLPRWTPDGGDGPFGVNEDGTKFATNSLGPLSEYLGVNLEAWHSADADSEASAMIVQKILERAAERDDVPKHLLDVDNLPKVVNERRARHKLEMDKYFDDMKKYKTEMDAYNASQADVKPSGGQRLSSGAARRKGTDSTIFEREGGRASDNLEPSPLLRKSSDGKDNSALEINGKMHDIKMVKNEDGNFSVFIEDENGKKIAEMVLNSDPTSLEDKWDKSRIVSVSADDDAKKAGALEGILDSLLINNPEKKFDSTKATKEWFTHVSNNMDEYGLQGSRQVGFFGKFSDGERVTPDGDYTFASTLRIKPKVTSSKTIEKGDDSFTKQSYQWSGDVFDINGESVVFGAPEDAEFEGSVKKMLLNPFEISGLDPTSEEGREMAMKWISAIHGASIYVLADEQQFTPSSYVSALLYSATKGDAKAAEELEELAKRSNDWLEKLKEKEGKVDDVAGALPMNSRLVHQTSYKPTIDKDGYLVLRPLEDFPQKAKDDSEITVHRTTLHLAINHLAEGHIFRQESQGKSYVVMMALDSFVEQNPDSLENLSIVDTAATPPPGDGLRMAPGTFKVIEVNEGDNGRKMIEDALREDGVQVLVGGERSSGTPGADTAAKGRAQMLGVPNSVASDLPLTTYEMFNRANIDERWQHVDIPATTEMLQNTSKNTLLRMANRRENGWTSFEKKNVSSGNRFSSGETRKGKATRSSKEILDEAAGLGIEWQGKTVGTSKEDVDRRVTSSAKMLKKSKELGLTDVPEISDEIKKIFNDYADGKINLRGMREAILFTDPKDEKLRQWAFGKEQLPIGWRVAAAREIALSQNDAELVKKIDDFIAFMGDIDNVSDEELEELIRKASVDFGKNMGSPIIQTPDVKRIIRGAGGVTVHDTEERKLDNLSGTTGMGESLTISARRRAETMYGLPFTGENTPEDRAITAMRPISGHSLPKDSHLAREKRMKKIYGEDFATMYDFPIGSDVADLSQTAKYGRSHIVLSDAVNERTKVVNGDAVSRFGSDGAAVAELESVGEAGISYADPFGMLFSSMTGDSGASIAGPLDPTSVYSGKYNETATLGTFDPSEVRAVYIADIGQTRRDIGDVPQGMNPDYYGNLSVIFDFAKTRDEILDSRGTELVAQIGEPRGANGQMGILEYLHPENVELFNASMTSAWLDRYDGVFGEIPREVLIPAGEPGTTPYEAYLRAKINSYDKDRVGVIKENAGTFGEKRDGREFGLEVLTEELDRAVNARKSRTAGGARLSSGEAGRSPGLKANRDRSVSEYGMEWKPRYSDKEWVKNAKNWEGWENVPITEVDLSSEIRPTESHLKGSSIDKVVSGEEAFREGYHPNIVIDTDGKMYVSDGHNRVAMHRALGNEKMTARIVDLRKQDAPWGGKATDRMSSGALITDNPKDKNRISKQIKARVKNMPLTDKQKEGIEKAFWDMHVSQRDKDGDLGKYVRELSSEFGPETSDIFLRKLLSQEKITKQQFDEAIEQTVGKRTLNSKEKRDLELGLTALVLKFGQEISKLEHEYDFGSQKTTPIISSSEIMKENSKTVKRISKSIKDFVKGMPLDEDQKEGVERVFWNLRLAKRDEDGDLGKYVREISVEFGPEMADLFISEMRKDKKISKDRIDAAEKEKVGKESLPWARKQGIGIALKNVKEKFDPDAEGMEKEYDRGVGTSGPRLSSGEGPRANKPTRVKKYKGYDLKEPDNPAPKDGEYPDDVVEAAKAQRDKVAKVEAEITKLLIDLAEKNKANMEGLDYRMKALKSLIRKIAAEKDEEHGGDAKKAAEAMSDIARYTMSYEPEDYIAGVKDVVEQMQKMGYELNVKNYWKGGDPYQGINVAVVHPDGTRFELQFHTPQSVADKEKIHAIYEDYRTETDPRKRFEMYNRMVRMAEKIGVPYPPDELLNIGNVREQPFTPR